MNYLEVHPRRKHIFEDVVSFNAAVKTKTSRFFPQLDHLAEHKADGLTNELEAKKTIDAAFVTGRAVPISTESLFEDERPKEPYGAQISTVHQVFDTPELLEMILLGLPIRDLLIIAQRVSKSWRSTMNGSFKLQTALFFLPLPYEPLQYLESKRHPEVATWARSYEDPYAYTIFKNPFCGWYKRNHLPIWRPDASWRRMCVSRPVAKVAEDGVQNFTVMRDWQVVEVLGCRNTVTGAARWKIPEFASEVRLIRRPKAWWI